MERAGTPSLALHDDIAVLERVGDVIRFNPRLLEFAGHYHFSPRPVARARGNEKGRVERAIRYLRDSFFAARSFRSVDDLNAHGLLILQPQPATSADDGGPGVATHEIPFHRHEPSAVVRAGDVWKLA